MTRALERERVEILYKSLPSENFQQVRNKTMVVLLFETGMRESELLSLTLKTIR